MDVLAFLTLDIQRPNISAIVYGMQGDRQSRAIRAQLVDGSTQWTPPAGTFFVISYAKPDGTHGIYSQTETGNAAVTVSGSVATIALAEQVLTVAGDVPMTLTMFNADGERLSTFTWLLIVKPAVYSDAAFMSTDYYNLLTEQIAAVLKAQESITGLTATATTLAPGSAATVTVTGGTGADDPFNFEIGIPRGDTGAQGATGAPAEITAQIVEYQSGTSGTTAPTGAWSTTVPAVPAGQYLWTRSTVTFNSGSPVVSYSVSRMGVDGTGSVKTVNNQSPDSSGDILLSSSNIPTPDFSSITSALDAKVNTSDIIDVAHGGTGANTAAGALSNLGAISASVFTIERDTFTANGLSMQFIKYGKIIEFEIYGGSTNAPIEASAPVTTFPEKYRRSSGIQGIAFPVTNLATFTENLHPFFIDGNGVLTFRKTVPQGLFLRFFGTFILY